MIRNELPQRLNTKMLLLSKLRVLNRNKRISPRKKMLHLFIVIQLNKNFYFLNIKFFLLILLMKQYSFLGFEYFICITVSYSRK